MFQFLHWILFCLFVCLFLFLLFVGFSFMFFFCFYFFFFFHCCNTIKSCNLINLILFTVFVFFLCQVPNNVIKYAIKPGYKSSSFMINANTGEISTIANLANDPTSDYNVSNIITMRHALLDI